MSKHKKYKLSKKIVGYKVVNQEELAKANLPQPILADTMHEGIERPDLLLGSTYKIKSPLYPHALYVTINDIILNVDTEHEERRPYEIFINSKNMEHFQWVLALTRVTSAVLRKGGDITFLVEELKGVFDPKGGYYKKGGVFMPSLVAEIGHAIEAHLKRIGMIQVDTTMRDAAIAMIEQKGNKQGIQYAQCPKCNQMSLIKQGGCDTCTQCSYSLCG
jgi:hypothetical protein